MADIAWNAPAELRQVGVDRVIRGDLAHCVREYRGLDEADRPGAIVICEELVPMADGRPAVKSIEEEDLVWLSTQLPD